MTRGRRITNAQAGLGLLGVAAAVAAVVGLSYLLLPPRAVEVQLPAPLEQGPPGEAEERPCPGQVDLRRRGSPIDVTSEELIACPEVFDGELVQLRGEAAAALLRRGDRAWVQLNDDPYALSIGPVPEHRITVGGNAGMAVLLPPGVAEDVEVGGFRRHGTGLLVTGRFLRSHPADPGSPAIDAASATVIRPARDVRHPIFWPRAIVAAVLLVLTLGLALALAQRRRTR